MSQGTTNNAIEKEARIQLTKSIHEINREASRYQELSVEHFSSLTKFLITLSTGAIVLSINSLAIVKGPKLLLFISIIIFILTILACLMQFYFTSRGFKLLQSYKRYERRRAELMFNQRFDPEYFDQEELDAIDSQIDENFRKISKRNNWSQASLITQSFKELKKWGHILIIKYQSFHPFHLVSQSFIPS